MKAIKFFSITAILMMVVASMAFSFDGQFDMRCYACMALEVQKKADVLDAVHGECMNLN